MKNNKQRAGVHVVPKPPPPKAPTIPAPLDDAMMREIIPMLEGKAPPPNEFVGYLAEQVQTAKDERTMLAANLRQLTSQVNQIRDRMTALEGEINGRLRDIQAWWKCKSGPATAEGKPFLLKPESEAKDAGPSNPKA